jgi:hypothetical protein
MQKTGSTEPYFRSEKYFPLLRDFQTMRFPILVACVDVDYVAKDVPRTDSARKWTFYKPAHLDEPSDLLMD